MTKNEKLAWLGGFFDGEGCICIIKRSDGFQGSVALSQKKSTLLEKTQSIMAAHDILGSGPHRVKWAVGEGYKIEYGTQKGVEFLKLLLPYLQDPEEKTRALFYIRFFIPGGSYPPGAEKRKLWPEWLKIRASARK